MASPMFYNLNSALNYDRRGLENAVMQECELKYEELGKYDDEQLRWMLIEKRHQTNEKLIRYHRKEEK